MAKKLSRFFYYIKNTGHRGHSYSNFQKSGIFGNLKVLKFQNRHLLIELVIFDDFIAILGEKILKILFRDMTSQILSQSLQDEYFLLDNM